MDDMLIVERPDGRLRYPIKTAGWNAYEDERDDAILYIQIETELPIREAGRPPRDEWWDTNDQPWWLVRLIQPGLRKIVPGIVISLPEAFNESRNDVMPS